MAFVKNNSKSELFSSRSSRSVMDGFRKSLLDRMKVMEGAESLALLRLASSELAAEEAVDAAAGAEIAQLSSALAGARFSDEISSINARLVALAAFHFKARSSVSALHEFSTAGMEQLLATALTIAVDSLSLEGALAPNDRYALLASGRLGRREARMKGTGSLILVFDDTDAAGEEYFSRIGLRLEALLVECSLPAAEEAKNGAMLWTGPVSRWLLEVESGLDGAGEIDRGALAKTFELVADSRYIWGDRETAAKALDKAGALLQRRLQDANFRQYAKSVANMPVALGLFGRIKTVRTGKHRGEFCLEDLAITPLIAAVRMLAVYGGVSETGTAARIWSLLNSGSLSVNLADRLLTAFQSFIRYQVELEMSHDVNGKLFFNPHAFSDDARERFKEGLEDIGTLQRFVYQQIVEVV